jgi:hypothetical protein
MIGDKVTPITTTATTAAVAVAGAGGAGGAGAAGAGAGAGAASAGAGGDFRDVNKDIFTATFKQLSLMITRFLEEAITPSNIT